MTFDGPPSESDINVQVDMINAAIAKKPKALALAVLDTDSMFADPTFLAALKTATPEKPVTIGVQSQDATSASIVGRTTGFINQMVKQAETLFAEQVAVTGHEKFKKAATTDGKDFDRTSGKFKNITVVGFDAGKAQKAAVKNGWFLGSVTQDPYMIGYLAVELAVKALNGEKVADSNTGCKFCNTANMDQADIAQLLYD